MSDGRKRLSPEEQRLYALYDELDRLEELIEDMAELGVSSRDEAEARIVVLNQQIDELEATLESGE
ncbi:MAG TPA: hypothetical protein VIL01_02005 [Thermomicrobiales bacterium]